MLLIESYGMELDAATGSSIGPVVIAGAGSEVLFEVLRPGVGMAVWGRTAGATQLTEIAAMPAVPAFDVAVEAAFDRVAAALLGAAPCTLSGALGADISGLATMFSVVAMSVAVRCRLRSFPLSGDLCFLPETAELRLLCAYQGPGIDWLPPDGPPGRLDRFCAAIVKGDAYPGRRGPGHRHRPASGAAGLGGCLLLDVEAA